MPRLVRMLPFLDPGRPSAAAGTTPNHSTRYRALNLVGPGRAAGLQVEVSSPGRIGPPAGRALVVIALRPPSAGALARLRRRGAGPGARWAVDFDDLIFAQSSASPAARNRSLPPPDLAIRCARYRAALRSCSHVMVSTAPLAEAVRRVHPAAHVAVVPNGLDLDWADDTLRIQTPWQPGQPRVLRYMPGTTSHQADFTRIAGVLAAFLARHPQVVLEVVGPLQLDISSFPAGQARQRPAVSFAAYGSLVTGSWAVLAPLEDTPFNRCKSAIKFLESAGLGCPCVASPIPDLERCRAGGLLTATRDADWLAALEALLDDEIRMNRSLQGGAWVRAEASAAISAQQLARVLAGWEGGR